ncbi:MAG: hypothetical protein DI498_00350 [Paracoccus denitrificans]|nr:MAG: hypothetical protein DI498_00350 [Paracoccus denitrificans]PZO86220.1 MAG: hypothetical protein DI633_00350 [Paracoccus denitrificans]
MAQWFGGKYSPNRGRVGTGSLDARPAPRPAPGEMRHRFESRTTWITVMAVPMLFGAFFGGPVNMALNFAGFGIIAAAMYLTREGLQAEAAYDARRMARRPAIPRKLFGGILTGLGLATAAVEPGSYAAAGVVGVVGAVLHWLAFGPDPMSDKGMEGVDTFQQDRVARMVEEAEGYLQGMSDAILRTRDRQLEARVAIFAATARDLFDKVEQDPADLAAARRYMGVYLMGARDATVKFADLYAQTHDPRARSDYDALLGDLEQSFRDLIRRLQQGSRTDMDIEITVLRDRLAREGVRMTSEPPLIGSDPLSRTHDDLFKMPVRDRRG